MFEGYQVIPDAEMRSYTTLKLGGKADWLAMPGSSEETAGLLREARERGIPVTVIGHGSNLLVKDGGIRGLVIRIGKDMNRIETRGKEITAQAGAMMGAVASAAAEHGIAGLEFMSGIPGTAGGGAVMNAGAYGGEMSQVVTGITGVTEDGEIVTVDAEELDFGYRHSKIPDMGLIVTEVRFRGTGEDDPAEIRARMTEINRRRAEKQPLDVPSAGSTFKRPEGAYAAALIDECGLKGYAVGGAMVSPKHAGFLVNTGESAKDFLDLVRYVQRIVKERTGYDLETEIRILGEE